MTSRNIRLRRARPADLYRLPLPGAAAWFVPALARTVAGRGAVLVVDGFWHGRPRLVACGTLTLWPRTAEIADLYVAPGWRGLGIGSALVAALEAEARDLGAARLEIAVAASNPRARALYERLGYHAERTVMLDLGNGEEEVTTLVTALPPADMHAPSAPAGS